MIDAHILRLVGIGCLVVSFALAVACVRVFVRLDIRSVYGDLRGARQQERTEG